MVDEKLIQNLKKTAFQIRKDILIETTSAQSGHPGGSLSATDIMVCLYFHKMTKKTRHALFHQLNPGFCFIGYESLGV